MMKKFIWVFILLVLPAVSFAQSAPPAQSQTCKALYQEIEGDLAKANYCSQDSDCDTLELGGRLIKFGCFHFVNKATDKDAIYEKMRLYYVQCEKIINDCSPSPRPVCVKSKCVAAAQDAEQ
jgi:hypothetical protein